MKKQSDKGGPMAILQNCIQTGRRIKIFIRGSSTDSLISVYALFLWTGYPTGVWGGRGSNLKCVAILCDLLLVLVKSYVIFYSKR